MKNTDSFVLSIVLYLFRCSVPFCLISKLLCANAWTCVDLTASESEYSGSEREGKVRGEGHEWMDEDEPFVEFDWHADFVRVGAEFYTPKSKLGLDLTASNQFRTLF